MSIISVTDYTAFEVGNRTTTRFRRKRIAFLDHTAQLGGGEIALLNLVSALDHSQFHPIVVLFDDGPLRAKLQEAGIDTHVLPLSSRIANVRKDSLGAGVFLRLKDLAIAGEFVWRLREWLIENQIDLVHCNSLKSDILGGFAARLAGRRCVWHIRDRISNDYLPASVVSVFRALCRFIPTRLIANSSATARELGGMHATVVLGGVRPTIVHDGTFIPDAIASLETPDTILRVGMIGRITWWKGQDVFIRAAAIVRKRFPQARFLIVGAALFSEAEYDQSIRGLVKQLSLQDVIEFTGFREDVSAILKQLDLVVHASTTGEPFGQVVIEAMAAGKPIVATDGGGVPEIVTPECGLLVPMKNVDAMADAISLLLADRERRLAMGRHGRARVKNHFLMTHTAEKVGKLYMSILRLNHIAN